MTGARYRAHAHAIARAFRIRLNEHDAMPFEAAHAHHPDDTGGEEVVCARTIRCAASYAIVMHEFGHILHPAGRLRDRFTARNHALTCDEEHAAWEWAERHALGGWTADMEAVKRFGLATYERQRRRSA